MRIQADLAEARRRTDELFALLIPAAMYDRPIPERHRIIFYLGHLEAFDWNQIGRGSLDLPSFHPSFDKLFEFGIDPPLGSLPLDQPSDWPSVDEVRNYNARVRGEIDHALEQGRAPEQIWRVAIEHRLMHAETLAYMWHNLPADRKIPPSGLSIDDVATGPAGMVEVPGGDAILGRKRGDGFGWDNEFDEHAVPAPGFAVQARKVTNGDYLKFVNEGAAPPHFWTRRGDEWLQRTMFGETPLPLSWPAYVTQAEAAAYASWKGKQLPSEAQYHRAADRSTTENCNFERWDPAPVSEPESGIGQLTGNGWEWTSTIFAPFPGFEPFPFYPGYSANFFDGEHYVLKGASPRTAACFLRRSFRNWFRRDYPYLYAGFRLVEN